MLNDSTEPEKRTKKDIHRHLSPPLPHPLHLEDVSQVCLSVLLDGLLKHKVLDVLVQLDEGSREGMRVCKISLGRVSLVDQHHILILLMNTRLVCKNENK